MSLRHLSLDHLIERNARQYGERTAVLFEDQRVTHQQFRARTTRLASGLSAAGVTQGDRVAILAQNRLEYLDLYGAAARIGAVIVPINWRLTPDEILHCITDTSPVMVLTDGQYQAGLQASRQRCQSVRRWVAFDGDGDGDGFDRYAELLRDAPGPVAEPGADDGFVIMHTAAVGGLPRGAELTHQGLLLAGTQLNLSWRLGPDDVNLGMLPLFHVTGLGLFLAVLQAGGSTVLSVRFDPVAAARQIAEHRVSVLASFAPMLGAILDAAQAGGDDLSSLRAVTGLEAGPTIARLETTCPDARFWSGFGQSELSGMVTLSPFREQPGSAGRPTLFVDVEVVDELDRPLGPGVVGEIVARGPMVFKGYWQRDDDNAQTFRNGWHHTGDLGRWDDGGYLWYAGRSPAKELIKPGGENVYPAEVERAILQHPAIAEVVVIGVPDPQWGEAVKAVCVCRPQAVAPPAEDIVDFVGERIARFKRPRYVVFVASLPRTAAGAVDRAQVKHDHGQP
jgi:acyl-CoA synthetase (AMP-forming)/AMP-acid ligase II